MGNSTWNPGAYRKYSRSVANKSQQEIFTNTDGCHDDLNPAKFTVRESCDSPQNPASTPIIVGVDETGSMGHLATEIIKQGLGVIVEGVHQRKPVTDPHILLAAVGDMFCDLAPLQATQFEADTGIVTQVEKFYIEGHGGGNGGESYPAVWWLALHKTRCEAITKRGRKGYLFTIGDEAPHMRITSEQIRQFMGGGSEGDVDVQQLLTEVCERWHVFHLITPTRSTRVQGALAKWRDLLGERAFEVADHTKLGEIIVSTMQVNEGHDFEEVVDSWDGTTGIVVRQAVSGLARSSSGVSVIDV